MFETVKFPAGVTDLDTSLTNVDGDTLTHFCSIKRLGINSFEKEEAVCFKKNILFWGLVALT